MIPALGNISLMLALLFIIGQVIFSPRFYRMGAITVFLLILFAFSCLVYSYAVSDFSVVNVYNNSSNLKPMLYKITGSWGNHEGSMLLLVLILSLYNLIISRGLGDKVEENNKLPIEIKETAYLTQLLLTAGFLAFLTLTSNPFERIFPAPENGLGLNPLLQDIGLAIHPPMLYLGYIGFSVAFSFAIAALIHGEAREAWAKSLRQYVLTSWAFLTFGIGLGSWWAYRELGWGGFWFWDPVENVSIMPWLSATALYHSLIVLEKRRAFAVWSVLLCIITFILGLIGIFLVRSGVVSSVHAFASDPSRGVFILGFLGFTAILAFSLFAARANKLSNDIDFANYSRETIILINNIFFVTLSATVLLGTLYPIFLEVLNGTRVSVGAPYFNATFNSLAIVMLVFAAIAPSVNWKNGGKIQKKIIAPLLVGAICGVITFIKHGDILTIVSIAVAGFLFISSIQITVGFKGGLYLKKLTVRSYAMVLAHAGAAVLVFGIAITSCFGVEKEKTMVKGDVLEFGKYQAVLVDGDLSMGKNYILRTAHFRILENGNEVANLKPEIRLYPVEKSTTLEADIHYSLFSNIYAAVGEIDNEGVKYATRLYYKPMINLIWLGCIMMALGGLLAVFTKPRKNIVN